MSGSHREERHVWTSEMPNLQSTARRRRTAAAAHEGSRPEGAQLYVVPCPRCGASVPFAAATANAMASSALAYLAPEPAPSDRRRAPTVHQKVRVLLAARD